MSHDLSIQPLCMVTISGSWWRMLWSVGTWKACLWGKCFLIACLSYHLLHFSALSKIFSSFIDNLAFFFSLGPTLTGILPYAGLKFYMYEKLKMHVPEEHQKSILMRLSCGALAGLFGQTLTYPLDVVKRQMQVFQHNFMSSAG